MINFNDFEPIKAVNATKKPCNNKKGVLTLISSKKNGYRILIPAMLAKELQLVDEIQIGFVNQSLLIGRCLPKTKNSFPLRRLKNVKFVVYSKSVVKEIADKLDLDFTDKVSFTFYNVELDEWKGNPVAKISKGSES